MLGKNRVHSRGMEMLSMLGGPLERMHSDSVEVEAVKVCLVDVQLKVRITN